MKFEIPPTKLLIAIFACTLSIASTTDHSIFDDADRFTRNAAALRKLEYRRYIDVPDTLHELQRTARQVTSNSRVERRHDQSIIINVTRDEPKVFDFEHPPEYAQIVEKFYLTNLHTADRLAENVASIFGSILVAPSSGLSYEQYASLEMIHKAVKTRQFHMYRLLQVLDHLQRRSCVQQFYLIMLALSAELPPYLACAANFFVSQINLSLVDRTVLGRVVHGMNFLTGISEDEIAFGGLYVKEMEKNGYDEPSRKTEDTVGPFFVHIFERMSNHTLTVSQPLFASILLNLPNRDSDPIFNEYVRFVANIAWAGKIPNWSAKSYTPTTEDDVTFLIDAMVVTICRDSDVSYDIKQALWYIRDHFDRPPHEVFRATQSGIHLHYLFGVITPQEFSPHANRLKAQLTEYIRSHELVIQKTLAGMNSYGYTSVKDLLLAFLTRLRTRLPAEEVEIRKSVSALLSILMLKRQAWNYFGLREGGINLWTLLDTFNDSETNPKIAALVQIILNELLGKVGLWQKISHMPLRYMNKCYAPEVCLRELLQILLLRPYPDSLSSGTNTAIAKLIDMLTDEIDSSSIAVVTNKTSVCDCASTPQPHTAVTSEIPSEVSTVQYHTTTAKSPITASSEASTSLGGITTESTTRTVRPPTTASGTPSSDEPTLHDTTTTTKPSISSETPSDESSEHQDTTRTVRPLTTASGTPSSDEPTLHDTTTTTKASISSETPSDESSEHQDTTRTVRPLTTASGTPSSDEPTLHDTTTTTKASISSETPSDESSEHQDTTRTVRPLTTASGTPSSDEPTLHDTTTTTKASISSETPSDESSEHQDTTRTVRPLTTASGTPSSDEPTLHDTTTTTKASISSETPSDESSENHDTTRTVRPPTTASSDASTRLVSISTEHGPREKQTTEKPDYYTISDKTKPQPGLPDNGDKYTTTARTLVTAIHETSSERSTEHPYTITITPSTQRVASSVLPINTTVTVKPDTMEPAYGLPPSVNPEDGIHVYVPDLEFALVKVVKNVEHYNPLDILTIPSIVCLQETPSADKLKGTCEKDLFLITEILTRQFGEDYIKVLLGDDWIVRYPTRLSLIVALLENAEKRHELSSETNDLRLITRYKTACNFVSSYVLPPLIANSRNLTTAIVWSTYNRKNPSDCNIGSDRPQGLDENAFTLPLVNPTSWLLPVDSAHPFANLLPQLPRDDPYAIEIQPLTELCNTGNVLQYLGPNWNSSQYTNRGELFTSMLHTLLQQESVRLHPELYDVIKKYLILIEKSTPYIHIPRSYVYGIIQQYHKQHETDVTIPPPEIIPQREYTSTLTDYVSHPLQYNLPQLVYPGLSIHVKVSDLGLASLDPPNSPASPDVVMLPPFDCLLNKPRPEDNPEARCQRDLIPISQPLSQIFGPNYIKEILGDNWEVHYPTRISLLVALLEAAEQNAKCQPNTELIAVINRYKAACEYVAAYVILPLVVDSQNLSTVTVWSTFDYENLWQSTIASHEADGFGPDANTIALMNPKIWLTKVDHSYPFSYLAPNLPHDDPHSIALHPLFSLFESGEIQELFGSDWKSSDYADRGSLFVSVLRKLLTLDVVKSNSELHPLVFNYLKALELPALYVHVPHSYIKAIFRRANIPWMGEGYVERIKIPNHIPLPPLINPKKILQVIIPESGAPVIESVRSKKLQSKIATILPSVNCLQGASALDDDEDAGDTCDSVLEFRLTEPLIEEFGDDYVEQILGADWGSLYPTRISFLAGLLRNAVKNKAILENPNQLHKKVTSFKEALEVAAPYIFLPMLANYQKLVTPIVWLTYNYDKPWESHVGRNPPQYPNNSTVTLPLVNPKIWYLPVNRYHPFSGFLPDFPSTNPYEETIAPLRSVLTLPYLRDLTGSEWEPSHYPNRGVFFVSAMHTLLKLGSSKMNPELYSLVRKYYMAIEIPSLYIHIPRSYINNAVVKAPGAWNVDLDGLMVALMEATTEEEHGYQVRLKIFLKQLDLLKQLHIVLPSSVTTKHEFLLTIITTALLTTTFQVSADIRVALEACQTRILTTGAGAEVVGWVWVSHRTTKTLIDLGNIVETVIPIQRIPEEHKSNYHALLDYFTHHRDVLEVNDFPTYRYHTYGAFLRGYLNHLVYKLRVSDEAMENIELVIPYIRYTGPGALPLRRMDMAEAP